jgi:hypothetical protein
MRVSGNAPQFTFVHSGCFVNGFYAVSTDILPFSSGFVPYSAQMQGWKAYLCGNHGIFAG